MLDVILDPTRPRSIPFQLALRQMRQRPALQINERTLPRRVHHLQHELLPVRARQMKVVVVFARKCPRRGLKPVKFPRKPNRFRFRYGLSYARFQQHAPNLIRNCRSASIPERSNYSAEPPVKPRISATQSFSRASCTETGPFTVDSRIIAGGLPNSIRRCSSSQVLRALSQMLALQLTGP